MEIEIRPYQKNDLQGFYDAVKESTPHLRPWMPWCHEGYCLEDTQQWISLCMEDWQQESAFRYIIQDQSSLEILGTVGIERVVRIHKVGELGYWVAANAKNKGVATQAAKLAVEKAFSVHDLQRIEIFVLTNNHASNRVAQKIGAVFEGTFRNKLIHNGESQPANCYSIIPSDL